MQRFDRLTETAGRLLDDVHEQVRVARNYLLLRDETFLELFKQKNEGVRGTLDALESLTPEPQWQEILSTVRAETDLLERYLSDVEEAQEDNVTLMVQALLLSSEQLRSEEHTSELQSRGHLVCRLLLEKKNKQRTMVQLAVQHL